MDFNSTTFILEIINFLVLIWILQRLFYKPLLAIIAQRKQFIDDSLNTAKNIQVAAEAQQQHYQQLLRQWGQEQQIARDALLQEIANEKQLRLTQLQAEIDLERQKLQQGLSKQQQEIQLQQQKQALTQGAQFATQLLIQAITPALDIKLTELLLENLHTLPANCLNSLTTGTSKKPLQVKISSVFPLDRELQQQLELKLTQVIPGSAAFNYHQHPELLAGLQIDLGHWVLDANLQHELIGFAEIAHANPG